MVVAARRGALHRVHGALGRLPPDLLGGALDALGQEIAEALPVADHLDEPVGAFDVAPPELEADLLLRQIALLHAFHDPAAHPAELVDVQAGAVETRVEPADALLVRGPDRPARARPSFVLGLVDELAGLGSIPYDLDVAVVHAAGIALMPAVVEAVAKLGGLPRRHVHRGQVRRVVLDGQGAELVEVGDAGQRPPAVERGGRGIGLEVVGDVVGSLHEPARIMRREGLGAADNAHGFQLLLPHHGAAAVLRSDVAIVALDGGEAHEALPGGADGVDGQAMPGETVLELEGLLGLPGVLALQMRGVADLDDVVVDVQVGELLGLPLDDDGVVTRVLEGRPEETVGLGRGGAVGLSAPRDDAEAARAPHGQPGQRARGQDEPVVGMVPVNLGPDLLVQDLGA